MATNTIVLSFKLEKTTPGAARYQEVDSSGNPISINDGAKVGTLYVRKSALGDSIPQTLGVQLTVG